MKKHLYIIATCALFTQFTFIPFAYALGVCGIAFYIIWALAHTESEMQKQMERESEDDEKS